MNPSASFAEGYAHENSIGLRGGTNAVGVSSVLIMPVDLRITWDTMPWRTRIRNLHRKKKEETTHLGRITS